MLEPKLSVSPWQRGILSLIWGSLGDTSAHSRCCICRQAQLCWIAKIESCKPVEQMLVSRFCCYDIEYRPEGKEWIRQELLEDTGSNFALLLSCQDSRQPHAHEPWSKVGRALEQLLFLMFAHWPAPKIYFFQFFCPDSFGYRGSYFKYIGVKIPRIFFSCGILSVFAPFWVLSHITL